MSIKILSLLKVMQNTVMVAMVTLAMTLFAPAVSAQTSDFNHMRTGFPLTGVHTNVECETCHVGGIFKGTPKDCAGCHSAGRRVVAPGKHASHIITNAPCDVCHTNTVSFLGARFNHIGVQPRACINCHNGGTGPGKPASHVITNSPCDSCHRSSAWIPAGYDHVGVVPGSCAQCHNNVTAIGKPSFHITTTPLNKACDDCHTTGFTTFVGAVYHHEGVVPGTCGTCHLGQSAGARPKTPGHIPTTGNGCDACHKNTVSFTGAIMDHAAAVSTPCATCHNGGYTSEGTTGALAKPTNHMATTAACNTCHYSYTTFTGATVHSALSAGICGTCHNGTTAKGVTAGHIPTTGTGTACDSCHTNTAYISFANSPMNHAVVTSTRCDVCHSGSYTSEGITGALAKPSLHIPTTITGSLDCNTCHTSTTSWTSEKMNHNSTTTGCKTCHNSGTSYLGSMDKKTLGSHEGSKTTDDCSQSGCHRPLGSEGTSWVKWN